MASSSGQPLSYEMVEANHKKSCTLLSLKDYLKDELSSCSSSGFTSLPRRQCCLQVQPRSLAKSVFQKALEAVLNAIKFPRRKAKKGRVGALSRSFWKRTFQGGKATFENSVLSCSLTDAEMDGSVTTTNTCSVTNSATVDSGGKQDWTKEKVQFSPVSVLDCPIFDDDEEITSPFNSPSCSTLEGPKHRHVQKSQNFNRVPSLKPVDLDKNMSQTEVLEDEPIYNHRTKPCTMLVSFTSTQNGNSCDGLFHDNVEENALELLTRVKMSIPYISLRIDVEKFLFDFFKKSILENIDIDVENHSIRRHLCKVAEDWIYGKPQKQYVSLQTREGREIYVKEMDKCVSWRTFDEEIQQLVMEIEVELCTRLVNELVVDLAMCYFLMFVGNKIWFC